ncbi:response regulator [Rhizomicrobium electricum]|jgi:two-component system response regulator TctD|uniref:Response regulator transcription factor n=1 Tax=Rhizomicrobium electricum TaxID=480070 RepID=A0ABP3Q658_9PROT|nr:response regulator transcription factor [Rhizomicrobium electricum]NIJ49479.1 two-component system response regulator TctD [Rhizomicrobium electricum]
MTRLLIVEDNRDLQSMLQNRLAAAGFTVDLVGTMADADAVLAQNCYDIVVLDLGLPDGNALALLRSLRARNNPTPVLVLTARGSVNDRVEGLTSGADDYLVKPFAFEELHARLLALLRRPGTFVGRSLKFGNVAIDSAVKQVFIDNTPQVLPAREIATLEVLMRRCGCVVPKEVVEGHLYGLSDEVRSNAVEASIYRLRKLLSDLGASINIHTIRGVGYMLHEVPR